MSAISWNEAAPTAASTASSGDDEIRSFLTAVATGVGESFYWPGSAASQGASTASGGELQLGTARLRAKIPGAIPTFANGYLSLNTLHISVDHIGASWQGMLGHSSMLDVGSGPAFPQTTRWLVQEGTYTSSGTTTNVTFATPYTTAPAVFLCEGSPYVNGSTLTTPTFYCYGISSVTTGGFTSLESELPGTGSVTSAALYAWRAEGLAPY